MLGEKNATSGWDEITLRNKRTLEEPNGDIVAIDKRYDEWYNNSDDAQDLECITTEKILKELKDYLD